MIKVRCRPGPDDLPPGYQFGDMRFYGRIAIRYKRRWEITPDPRPVRTDDRTIAPVNGWNVIEGEPES